jgi:hypothetical protein
MTTQNSTRSGLPERSVLVAFLLFIVVGGGASVAIRATYAEMAPFWAAASRFVLGALAMDDCILQTNSIAERASLGRRIAIWNTDRWASLLAD